MAQDRMKILEERLTRLEAALAQRGTGAGGTGVGAAVPGTVVDPPPWAAALANLFFQARPSPIADPAPWPWWGGGWGRPRWPTPIVDPGPFPTPVVDPAPWPNPIADPAVFARSAATLGRIGPLGGDPPPPDLSRFTAVQLETMLHSINAEKARLDAMEAMVKKQLETVNQ
jgi:hypothetical protein